MTAKSFFISIVLLVVVFAVGFGSRFFIFTTLQKKLFERNFLDRELIESKQGGNTPQETWNLYLDALEREDIETAVSYWWPSERDRMRTTLQKLKEAGLLKRYALDHGMELREKPNEKIPNKQEKAFLHRFTNEKEIALTLTRPELYEIDLKLWAEKGINKEEITAVTIFKFNSYSKKWLIKE